MILSKKLRWFQIRRNNCVHSLTPIQQSVYVQTVAARLNLQEGLLVSEVSKKVAQEIKRSKGKAGVPCRLPP